MNYNNDPYDTGTPKYSTIYDIYNGLKEVSSGEERDIMLQMFEDVSWENQDYYYIDKADMLLADYNKLSDYGNSTYLLELAMLILYGTDEYGYVSFEVHDTVHEALYNSELAKKLGFKKIFVEHMLAGKSEIYNDVKEELYEAIHELDYAANFNTIVKLYDGIMKNHDIFLNNPNVNYNTFCNRIYDKIMKLDLAKEKVFIAESRAHLTAHDDFIFGLRINKELYDNMDKIFQQKYQALQAGYEEKLHGLLALAESQGAKLKLDGQLNLLEE